MSIINNFNATPQDTAKGVKQYHTPDSVTLEDGKYIFNFDFEFNHQIDFQFDLRGSSYESVTEFTNPYIRFKNAEAYIIEGLIRNNRYYDLLWDGSKWIAKLSTFGISASPIVITSSGTYSVEPGISYKCVAVGGGGGSAHNFDGYYGEYENPYGGGAGGKIEDTFTPTSSTLSVTIGAAGSSGNGRNNAYTAGSGGTTYVGGYYAATGGTGASSRGKSGGSHGTGGTYSGGTGSNGQDGSRGATDTAGYTYGNGGAGWYVNGSWYGRGGSVATGSGSYEIKNQLSATKGIVVLTPMLSSN